MTPRERAWPRRAVAAFGLRVVLDGAFERCTIVAMSLPSMAWLAVAALSRHWLAPPGSSAGSPPPHGRPS